MKLKVDLNTVNKELFEAELATLGEFRASLMRDKKTYMYISIPKIQ